MSTWRWAESHYLILLVFVPLLYVAITYYQRKRLQRMRQALGEKILPFLLSGISLRKAHIKLILLALALVPLVLALARPQFGETKENIKSLGVELMILFDVSQSMLAEDVSPSRLEFAKREMARFLDKIPGSKVGLVAFAGSAALISPITTDASAMKMFIDSLTPEAISTQGTEFKLALEQAEAAFARGGQGEDPNAKVTRVILIVSDGEDQEPGALEAAEKLTEKGVRIFSVAVGTEKGGSIPLRDPNGFLRGYKKDGSGQVIVSTSKGDVLKSIAHAGKGSFYTASFAGSYVDSLVEDINKLEKTEFDSQTLVNYQERFQGFLLIGILLLMVELYLHLRKTPSSEWRGRFQPESR
jgi:Ca-activated chloride channel family protein